MVRYKRYKKRRYGKSTRTIMMKFQSFMDIATSASSMQVITVSAGGKELLRRLSPQFQAYKYYKIGNISVKLVPASTLPVDPTGLSYEAGENPTVDPRDQLTPGMMRITNGEDIFEDITGLTDAQQHGIFNNMLLDPRWFKWMLQSGVKRHATPRYWQIGQLHQDKWPGYVTNIPHLEDDPDPSVISTYHTYMHDTAAASIYGGSSPYGLFQTGHRGVLGWLPTDGMQEFRPDPESGTLKSQAFVASPPEIEVFKLVIPKMYRTNYYYRMFITETVYFKEPIVNFGVVADDGYNYRPLDVFHMAGTVTPYKPSYAQSVPTDATLDWTTGGNDGSS